MLCARDSGIVAQPKPWRKNRGLRFRGRARPTRRGIATCNADHFARESPPVERSGTHTQIDRENTLAALCRKASAGRLCSSLLCWHEPLQLVADIADEVSPAASGSRSFGTDHLAKRIGTPFAASCRRLRRPVVVTRASQTRPRGRRVPCTLSGGIAGVVPLLGNSFISDSRTASPHEHQYSSDYHRPRPIVRRRRLLLSRSPIAARDRT